MSTYVAIREERIVEDTLKIDCIYFLSDGVIHRLCQLESFFRNFEHFIHDASCFHCEHPAFKFSIVRCDDAHVCAFDQKIYIGEQLEYLSEYSHFNTEFVFRLESEGISLEDNAEWIIYAAIKMNQLSIIEMLLARGVNINCDVSEVENLNVEDEFRNLFSRSFINTAVTFQRYDIIIFLVKCGYRHIKQAVQIFIDKIDFEAFESLIKEVDFTIFDSKTMTDFIIAAICSDQSDVLKFLHGYAPLCDEIFTSEAIKKTYFKSTKMIDFVADHGVSIQVIGSTTYFVAVTNNKLKMVMYLEKLGYTKVDSVLTFYAAQNNSFDTLRYILRNNSEHYMSHEMIQAALLGLVRMSWHNSYIRDRMEMLDELLAQGANLNESYNFDHELILLTTYMFTQYLPSSGILNGIDTFRPFFLRIVERGADITIDNNFAFFYAACYDLRLLRGFIQFNPNLDYAAMRHQYLPCEYMETSHMHQIKTGYSLQDVVLMINQESEIQFILDILEEYHCEPSNLDKLRDHFANSEIIPGEKLEYAHKWLE